jgi:hypothetical protein
VPMCSSHQPPTAKRRPIGCGLFHGNRKDCPQERCRHAGPVVVLPRILRFSRMVRSVLFVLQGHETRSQTDVTDRDRDESSRRAICVWVRTNPQTQVR